MPFKFLLLEHSPSESHKAYFLESFLFTLLSLGRSSLVAQLVKNLPKRQETQVPFLGQEDSLEKEMATHSNILAWRILWTEETGRLHSMGSQESDTTWQLNWLKMSRLICLFTIHEVSLLVKSINSLCSNMSWVLRK